MSSDQAQPPWFFEESAEQLEASEALEKGAKKTTASQRKPSLDVVIDLILQANQ